MSFAEHASNGMMGAEGFGSDSLAAAAAAADGYNASSAASSPKKKGKPVDRNHILEMGKDGDRLKVLKQIMTEVIQGNNMSEFFPAVVKLVVHKDLEVRKLAYSFVAHYAEALPDIALLSISSFQKGLKDPNQLFRACALRVLTNIRIPAIVPITLISLKQAAVDMSPYVRKTAALALPKVFALAPYELESILEILDKLLADRTHMVLGSVVMAFEEICPDRLDLVHKHYRKLCNTLIDMDEWGQIAVLQLLTRYGRTQFEDPNADEAAAQAAGASAAAVAEPDFYGNGGDSAAGTRTLGVYIMDPDHRLLLRAALPLLHSHNAGVIMAVVQLYHHLAPSIEVAAVARPLVRLLATAQPALQHTVLSTIAALCASRAGLFEPHLKAFFVWADDPQPVRKVKLEILTALASETTIALLLREFREYTRDADKGFVALTIQCIGRCAARLPAVTDACMAGLLALLRAPAADEAVVAESVVVLKKLLQLNPAAHGDTVKLMAKMATSVRVPMARASLLWIVGEYSSHVPKLAPDVLRQLAQSFPAEEDIVKLQVLGLAAKLYLTNSKQTKLLLQYVLNLAKYDLNYDIRDRARLVRALLLTRDTKLHKHSRDLFLSEKPAPSLAADADAAAAAAARFPVGTLSHMLNTACAGLRPLPDFPLEAPDPTVRNFVEPAAGALDLGAGAGAGTTAGAGASKGFYSDDDDDTSDSGSSSSSSSDSDSSSSSSGSDDDDDEKSSGTESDTESESSDDSSGPQSPSTDSDSDAAPAKKPAATAAAAAAAAAAPAKKLTKTKSASSSSASDESSSDSDSDSSASSASSSVKKAKKKTTAKPAPAKASSESASSTSESSESESSESAASDAEAARVPLKAAAAAAVPSSSATAAAHAPAAPAATESPSGSSASDTSSEDDDDENGESSAAESDPAAAAPAAVIVVAPASGLSLEDIDLTAEDAPAAPATPAAAASANETETAHHHHHHHHRDKEANDTDDDDDDAAAQPVIAADADIDDHASVAVDDEPAGEAAAAAAEASDAAAAAVSGATYPLAASAAAPAVKHKLVRCHGLQVEYAYTRADAGAATELVLTLTNKGSAAATHVGLAGAALVSPWAEIAELAAGAAVDATVRVNFGDAVDPVPLELTLTAGHGGSQTTPAPLTPRVGELLQAVTVTTQQARRARTHLSAARGSWQHQHHHHHHAHAALDADAVAAAVASVANVAPVVAAAAAAAAVAGEADDDDDDDDDDAALAVFAGRLCAGHALVLIAVDTAKSTVAVHADDAALAGALLADLTATLKK